MATPAQIAANRANAALSTGPTTAEGKTVSRYNNLRHGLYARDVVLPGEDRSEYDAMLAELQAEFAPEGRYENALVRRLADTWWRLGRSAAIEAGLAGIAVEAEATLVFERTEMVQLADEAGLFLVGVRAPAGA